MQRKSIQDLREMSAEKAAEYDKVLNETGDKITEDQKVKLDALLEDIKNIKDKIKYEEAARDEAVEIIKNQARNQFADNSRIEVGHKPVYRNLGEQMLDVISLTMRKDGKNTKLSDAQDRFQKVVNAASGASAGVDGEGGYLIETDKSKDIITTSIETGVFASRVTKQPVGANADSFSYLAADDRDRSTGKTNGIQVYRKGETTAMISSGKATLKERELRLEDMYAMIYMTNRMLEDAEAMAAYTKRCVQEQFSYKLDEEIWYGNGVGKFLGVMSSDLPVEVAKVSTQAANTIIAQNVVEMLARFHGNIMNACWFVNQDCLPQFPMMTVGDMPVFIPGGSFANAPFGSLFGRPIVPVEFCKTVGDVGDIVLADLSQYLMIQKGGTEMDESIHVRYLYDETAFRFKTRNNGQPLHDNPITPLYGANTLSPFVKLAQRD